MPPAVETTSEPPSAPPTSRRREPVWVILLAGCYTLLTAVALVAWYVAGDAGWVQPLNLSTFWWSLPALGLVPLTFALGLRRSALLLAIPAGLWLWAYGAAFLPKHAAASADLRVAAFNTYVRAPGTQHVLDLVARQHPDVLLLEEVFPSRWDALSSELADTYPDAKIVFSKGVGGVAVFSRFPIVAVHEVGDATAKSRNTAVFVLDVNGRRVQVVPVHLISPCPSCGPSVLERLDFEGEVRGAEIGNVLDALDPDLPAVIGGDFNSNERSVAYRRLVDAGFRDAQREAGSGMGFTWPNDRGPGPVLRIDWLLTRGLTPVRALVGDGGASDHRPVVADLALPDGKDAG